MTTKVLLRPHEVEEKYGIAKGYQAKMRCSGDGPEFLKIGSNIFYEDAAIGRWLETKRRSSTSDPGPAEDETDAGPGTSVRVSATQEPPGLRDGEGP